MPFEIFESEQNKPFKIKGIAMRANVLSKNGRFYSAELVEGIVDKISKSIKENGSYPINMLADHPTLGTNKTLSTVGKVTAMYMEGSNAIIEAEIANTSLGKDVQELIRGKFVEGLSIRANKAKFRKKYIDGKMVNDVMEMELQGVDLVTNPGVEGAKVTDIIESDQSDSSNLFVSIKEEEEIMDNNDNSGVNINEEEEDKALKLIEAKLEDLKQTRPDLVESLKQELKPLFESEFNVSDLQESVNTLEGEKQALQESLDALKGEKETLESDLTNVKTKLEEAEGKLKDIEESEKAAKREAHIATKLGELKFADSVKEKLKAKVEALESIEEIDSVLESEVEFIQSIIQESTGVNVSGQGHTGENQDENNESEDDKFMKMVLEG